MRQAGIIFLLCFALAACSVQQQKPSTPRPDPSLSSAQALYEQRHTVVESIHTWAFKGRAAVQRGSEGWSATMHWRQEGKSFRLRIIAPLGRGTYEIFREEDQVSLIDANNNVYTATNPDELFAEVIGWQLPISNIEFWIRGLLAPGESPGQPNLSTDGLVKDFALDGWRVSILDYQSVPNPPRSGNSIQGPSTDNLAMPKKLFMNFDDTKMRVVINAWDLGDDGHE